MNPVNPTDPRLRVTTVLCSILLCVSATLLTGCGASKRAEAPVSTPAAEPSPVAAPVAAMTLRIASLDVSGFRGRMERTQIDELAGLIASKKIDVLAVQGITRYPTITTRTDLVAELSSATGMFQVFGETINLSGRQSGNAVFSSYPIASSDGRAYDGVSGNKFEGALRAIIDAGTRPLVVVSTRLPDPLGATDARRCGDLLSTMASDRGTDPLVVLGNLPRPPGDGTWKEVRSADATAGTLWFTPGPISISTGTSLKCGLGTLLLADVDLFPQKGR